MSGVRQITARRSRSGNTRMARFTFADFSGSIDCVIFPDDYERFRSEVRDDNICFVRGSVDRTGEKPSLIVTHIFSLAQAPRELTRSVVLKLVTGVHQEADLDAIARLLQRAKGRTPVYLQFADPLGRRAWFRVSEAFWVDVGKLPVEQLELLLGEGQVELGGLSNGNGNPGT